LDSKCKHLFSGVEDYQERRQEGETGGYLWYMANPKNVLFGPVNDEQKDYWQRNQLTQRDARLLDNHFNNRSHGQKFQNSMNAYSIPRSAKVALRETVVGGLPVWDGAATVWDERYAQAQGKLLNNNPLAKLQDPWQGRRPGVNEEIDAGAIMQQRLLSQAATPQASAHGPMPGHTLVMGQQQSQQQTPVCTLAEGHVFFQPLQIQGFGTTQPLARTGGRIQGLQGRQFEIQGTVTAYVIDGLQTIDLSKMEPGRLKPLVSVSAPLVGTFLVPQEAIQEIGRNGPGKQLLIDSGQQHRIDQRQNWQRQPQPQFAPQPQRPMNSQDSLQAQSRALLARRGLLKG
jgi:hypothetical protein